MIRFPRNNYITEDMKRYKLSSIITLTFLFLTLVVQSQNIILKQTSRTGIYSKGQKIVVKAFAVSLAGDTLHIKVYKNNTSLLEQKNIIIGKDSLLVYEGICGDPCSIIVEARSKMENASLGMLIDPLKLKPGIKFPGDFENYWNKLKKSLNALPFEIKSEAVLGTESDKGYSCEDIEINCIGPKPARGYFAKPEKAALKSLPIVLLVHAAGVKGYRAALNLRMHLVMLKGELSVLILMLTEC